MDNPEKDSDDHKDAGKEDSDKVKARWLFIVNWHIFVMATIEMVPLVSFSLAIIVYMEDEYYIKYFL